MLAVKRGKHGSVTVPGVAEVASIGGFLRQYQVRLNPDELRAFNIPLWTVIEKVRDSANEMGGRLIEFQGAEYMVRGRGYLRSLLIWWSGGLRENKLRFIEAILAETVMKMLIEVATALTVAAVVIGLFGYAFALVLAAFFSERQGSLGARLAYWLTSAPAQNLGIPCAAIAAYAIVAGLLSAFPPASNATGQLEFKVFGLEFSGPSGPITLWLMCFLGFILALKMLRV
jgi:hypothetical protein